MARPIRATAALLLSTGLFEFARGSFSTRGDQVSPGFDLEVVRGKREQLHARTLKSEDLPPATPGTTTTTTGLLPVGGRMRRGVPGGNAMLSSKMVPGSAININNRKLQESACTDGASGIALSSTVFPLLEGCLSPSVVDGKEVYAMETAIVFGADPATTTDPTLWAALYGPSSDDLTVACFSAESVDDVDPSEATWFCDNDGDGSGFTMADGDELTVSCGCSTATPSPGSTVSPAPAQSTTGASCSEGESFSIESETLSDAEGCFLGTTEVFNDETIYTPSGTADEGQIWVIAREFNTGDSSTEVLWALMNVMSASSDDENLLYCHSLVEAALYHPSEVPVWQCDAETTIAVECGCPSSPSPAAPSPTEPGTSQPAASSSSPVVPAPVPSPASPSTAPPAASPTSRDIPAPVPSPTSPASTPAPSPATLGGPLLSSNTCSGDGSFTITANAAPELDGCFLDINDPELEADGWVAYTVSGTRDEIEIAVFSAETVEGRFIWTIAEHNDGEFLIYCQSKEPANEVDPASASWICDLTGGSDTFMTVTEEDISIVCGSCTTTVVPEGTDASADDASTASRLAVGVVTAAAGAGIVAVVSAALAGW